MKKQANAVLIVTAIWMLLGVTYSIGGSSDSTFWWALDKINDRLFEAGILFVCSLCFVDAFVKYLCYASIFYVVLRCYAEVLYIISDDVSKFNELMFFYSGLYAGLLLVIFGIFLNVKRK